MRLHISRLKASEANGDVWKPLIQLEEGFRDEAQQAWRNVKTCWASGAPGPAADALFHAALCSALTQARVEVEQHFASLDLDPLWVRARLAEYRREA
jgi:hypothetical protein